MADGADGWVTGPLLETQRKPEAARSADGWMTGPLLEAQRETEVADGADGWVTGPLLETQRKPEAARSADGCGTGPPPEAQPSLSACRPAGADNGRLGAAPLPQRGVGRGVQRQRGRHARTQVA